MWSFRKLVAQYGEEKALRLLQYQKGFGEFDAKTSHWNENIDTPCNEIHDEIDSVPMTPLTMLELDPGVLRTLWRLTKNDLTSST